MNLTNAITELLSSKAVSSEERKATVASLLHDPWFVGAAEPLDLARALEGRLAVKENAMAPPNGKATAKGRRPRIPYDTPGTLRGIIKGNTVEVTQLLGRRFPRTVIDGLVYKKVPGEIIERDMGLTIHQKRNGGNSETHSRAIWRDLADKYNAGDVSVSFDPA